MFLQYFGFFFYFQGYIFAKSESKLRRPFHSDKTKIKPRYKGFTMSTINTIYIFRNFIMSKKKYNFDYLASELKIYFNGRIESFPSQILFLMGFKNSIIYNQYIKNILIHTRSSCSPTNSIHNNCKAQ